VITQLIGTLGEAQALIVEIRRAAVALAEGGKKIDTEFH